jgi:hypothetical protein
LKEQTAPVEEAGLEFGMLTVLTWWVNWQKRQEQRTLQTVV